VRLVKTVTGLSQLAGDDVTSLDAASIEQSITETQEEITTVMASHKAMLANARRAEEGQIRQRELKSALMESESIDRLVIEVTLSIARLEPVVAGYVSHSKECYDLVNQQQIIVNDIRAHLSGYNKSANTSEMAMLKERSQAELIKQNIEHSRERIEELKKRLAAAAMPVCPTCGQISESIGQKLTKEITNEIDTITKNIDACSIRCDSLIDSSNVFKAQFEDLTERASDCAVRVEAEDHKLCSLKIDHDIQVTEDAAHNRDVAELDRLRRQLADYERKRSKVPAWQQELESIQQLGSPVDLMNQASKIRNTSIPLYAKVDSLQVTLKKIIAAKQDEYRRV
jgi:hypothetical protein